MRVLIAVTLIVGWAAISIYALCSVAQDLVIIRHAPGPQQKANESVEEPRGDREQT